MKNETIRCWTTDCGRQKLQVKIMSNEQISDKLISGQQYKAGETTRSGS